MKVLALLLLLITVSVSGKLSTDCNYVNTTYYLTDADKVKNCFDSYQIDQEILDAIIRNLELVHDIYPYTDIAMNPPSEPPGYFKKVNFTKEIENLKKEFAESDRIVSKVFRPTMRLVNGFHDDHFNLMVKTVRGKYENIFSTVDAFLPFEWKATVKGDERHVFIHSPNPTYLDKKTRNAIESMYNRGITAKLIDGKDAFMFFSQFLGDFNTGKSPQGALNNAIQYEKEGLDLLRFPLDNLFDSHKITFSDSSSTVISFRLAFRNFGASTGTRDEQHFDILKKNNIVDESEEKEKELWNIIRNFKRRSIRQDHTMLPCDTVLNTGMNMNYIQIHSFDTDVQELFLQELVECVALFDTNDSPITIVLPKNGGGSAKLRALTQLLLMPTSDYRTVRSIRKSKVSERIAPIIVSGWGLSNGTETCNKMTETSQFESFWDKTEIDDFGEGVIHERTGKMFEDFKELIEALLPFKMTRFVRKPTEIIVATDGYCFSACSFFVANVIRAGAAVVVGYGLTLPGDDLFAAGNCPSGVSVVENYLYEIKNNSKYGLYVRSTTTESYDLSEKMDEKIPGDYSIYRVDKHTGYYGEYDYQNWDDLMTLLNATSQVYEDFKTACNPNNTRLLYVTERCKSNKPNAVLSGYACGSNGKWNKDSCKIASCKEGYIVDFDKDECIPNLCDARYVPPPSPSPVSSVSPTSQKVSSSGSLHPVLTLITTVFIGLLQIVH